MYIFASLVTSNGKESAHNSGDAGLIPGSGRSPGGGNGNSFLYSCLGKPMDRGIWQATVHGFAKQSKMTQQLNNGNLYLFMFVCVRMYLTSVIISHFPLISSSESFSSFEEHFESLARTAEVKMQLHLKGKTIKIPFC